MNINNCPFCGSGNVAPESQIEENDLFAEGSVVCGACYAEGPLVSNMNIGNVYFDLPSGGAMEDAAIKEWNKACLTK